MDISFQSIACWIMKQHTLFCAQDDVVNSPTDKDRYKNCYEEAQRLRLYNFKPVTNPLQKC